MNTAPEEYLYGPFFERVRRRFELCGTTMQQSRIDTHKSSLGRALALERLEARRGERQRVCAVGVKR